MWKKIKIKRNNPKRGYVYGSKDIDDSTISKTRVRNINPKFKDFHTN